MATKRATNNETRKNAATTTSTASNPSSRPSITAQEPPGPSRDAQTPQRAPMTERKIFTKTEVPPLQPRPHPQTQQKRSRTTDVPSSRTDAGHTY